MLGPARQALLHARQCKERAGACTSEETRMQEQPDPVGLCGLCLQVWQPDASKPALQLAWSPAGVLTCLAYLAAVVYYSYVRVTFTMALGSTSWWVEQGQGWRLTVS